MEKDWIMVRIKRTTYARIEGARKSLLWAYEMRQKELRFDDRGRVSVDQVLNILLDLRARHASRRARALAKRRARKKEKPQTRFNLPVLRDND